MKNKKNQTAVQPEPALIEDNQPQNTPTPQIITKESLEREKQEQLELFDTPPAGVYPKTDKKGRVIKYKRRGGVFAFFMGIFASLFLFVFCGGITISYFYYCYTLEDAGKTLGVDLSFLGADTTNKTASELLKLMSEYKEGYTEITVKDAKEKLGIDVADIVNKNLGVEVQDFYGIKIQVESVNGGKETTIGDFKLKELTAEGNLQKVIEKLLPEIYKRVELNSLLKLLQIDITTIDLPITKDALFQTELRQFKIGETTYAVDLTNSKILKNDTAVATIENNKFTLNDVEYEISTDRTKLTSASTTLDLAFPENSQKELSKLSVYDLLYSVLPNYVGGSEMTIDFIQKALGKELVPTDNPEFAKLLNSTITNLNIKDALDTVTLRSIEEVFELSIVPLDDEKFEDLLNLTVGNLSTEDVLDSLTVGAVLELAGDAITFPDNILFLKDENFKAQKLKDALDYVENLTFKEIIKIDDVEFYDNFTLSGQTFFVVNNTIATKNTTTLTEQDGLQNFALNGNNFVLYGQQVFAKNSTTISFEADKKFTLNGKTYYIDNNFTEILSESKESLSPQVLIDSNNCFELENYLCKIDKENSKIEIMQKQVDVENGRFTLNGTEFFVKDTCLENFVKVSDINEDNTFVLAGNTFKIDDENNQILDNSSQQKVSDITRTETIKLVMFGLRNVVVKDIIDGEYDDTLTSLDNITLGDLLGDQLTGFLSELKTVSLYEILNNPDVMLDKIKETTLEDLGVDPNSSPLLENVAKLTIGKILEDENALLDAIKTVTLDKLGFESTSPLFEGVANLSIGDILGDNTALLKAIENKTLSTITGSSDGIMSVIGNLTIGTLLDDSNAITNTLQNSTKTLAELLGQYDNFSLTTGDVTTKYYIIDSNIYKTSDLTNSVATISGDSFTLDGVTYTIVGDNINLEEATIATITRAPTSSLSTAILTMKVGDLFNGDFTTTLQSKIQDVKLGDVITTTETSPQLLKTLVDKDTTIGQLGETINNLTLADVLGEVKSGLLTYLTYTKDGETKTGGNIPLANIADATLDGIENIKLTKLCDDNVLPCLKNTVFDTTSTAYSSLSNDKQKEAVDSTTLNTIITAYIDYITKLS